MKFENGFWFLKFENDIRDDETHQEYCNRILCYDRNTKKWVKKADYARGRFPVTFPCSSYRAAKRHLRKHNEIPIGSRFILVSKWVGRDRYLTKKTR